MKRTLAFLCAVVLFCTSVLSGCNSLTKDVKEQVASDTEILQSGDTENINELIFGISDSTTENDPIAEISSLSTGESIGINVLSPLVTMCDVKVIAATENSITCEVQAPYMRGFFDNNYEEIKEYDSEKLIEIIIEYAEKAEKISTSVELEYTQTDSEININYQNPEFTDALTGGLVSDYEGALVNTPELFLKGDVINNGGYAVCSGDTLLYWNVSGSIDNPEYTLVSESPDGTVSKLYTDDANGHIFVLDELIYLNQIDDQGRQNVVCIDYSGNTIPLPEEITTISDVDEETGALICSWYPEISLYFPKDNVLKLIAESPMTYKDVINSHVYLYKQNSERDGLSLYLYDIETESLEEISQAKLNDSYYGGGSGCIIANIQETDNAIYYTYDYIDGSGGFWQGMGGLARVSKESYQTEFFDEPLGTNSQQEGPAFYAFEKDGEEYLLFCNNSGFYTDDTEYTTLINVRTKESAQSDMKVGLLNTPFNTTDNNTNATTYWLYPESDGEILQILPEITTELYYEHIQNVSYTGDKVFYEISYHKDNPTPNSWRDYTIEYKREFYVYDSTTEETKLLSSTI